MQNDVRILQKGINPNVIRIHISILSKVPENNLAPN